MILTRRAVLLIMLAFSVTLCAALGAAWAIRRPHGDYYRLRDLPPTPDPALKLGGLQAAYNRGYRLLGALSSDSYSRKMSENSNIRRVDAGGRWWYDTAKGDGAAGNAEHLLFCYRG